MDEEEDEVLILEEKLAKPSPFDEKLILKLVLEYVGKSDINDLLECRLVNHAWNTFATEVLEQNCYATVLDYKKMLQFKAMLWNTHVSKSKSEHQDLKLRSLRLSLRVIVPSKIVPEFEPEHTNEVAKASEMLILHPQLRVAFLNCLVEDVPYDGSDSDSGNVGRCKPFGVFTHHELFELLELTSNDLTSFTMCCADQWNSTFKTFKFDWYLPIIFPKLTSIHYKVPYTGRYLQHMMMDFNTHIFSVINKAPKLTKLKLYIWKHDEEGSAKSLLPLIQASSANLEQLNLDFDETNGLMVLNALSEMKFPFLTTLKLESSGKCWMTNQFKQFLENHSSHLNSLEINFFWSSTNELEMRAESLAMMIPVLPKLLHFGFYPPAANTHSDEHIKAVHTTFTQMMIKFPALNSVSMDLEVFHWLAAHVKSTTNKWRPKSEQYPKFPNISNLEVEVSIHSHKEGVFDFDKLYLDTQMYHHTFPNITKLVISQNNTKESSLGRSFSADERTRIISLLFDFLCGECGPRIQTLEMRNYTQPWLAWLDKILPKHKFKGVKSLKLLPPSPSTRSEREEPKLDLLKILPPFSNLEYFQFGKAKMFPSEIQTIRESLKRVRRFENSVSNKSKRQRLI